MHERISMSEMSLHLDLSLRKATHSSMIGVWDLCSNKVPVAFITVNNDGTFSWSSIPLHLEGTTLLWKPTDVVENHNTIRQCIERVKAQWKAFVIAYEAQLNPPPPPRKPLFNVQHTNSLVFYLNTLMDSSTYQSWGCYEKSIVSCLKRILTEKYV